MGTNLKKENEKERMEILNAVIGHIEKMTIHKESYNEYFGCHVYTKENRLQHVYANNGIVITEKDEKEMNTIIQNCWKEIFIL